MRNERKSLETELEELADLKKLMAILRRPADPEEDVVKE